LPEHYHSIFDSTLLNILNHHPCHRTTPTLRSQQHITMASVSTNDRFRFDSVNTRNVTGASPLMTMSFFSPTQGRSRDDPPSPPPQPPPSPASWNRLHSVSCVTRRHPSILTLRQAGRPCAFGHLNSGVNDGLAGKYIIFATLAAAKIPLTGVTFVIMLLRTCSLPLRPRD
jgi:hypothetical protein